MMTMRRTAAVVSALMALVDTAARARAQSPPPATASGAPSEPDGNDDARDEGSGPLPTIAHFERVGRPPLALHRICDLAPLGDALYASHANQPLGSDGATITRYQPDAQHPFTVAFDWNRPGQPAAGGGAGQGFLRIHVIGGRLFVPDSDPPYAGFGYAYPGTEGYVFVSDANGVFAPARGEHLHPPGPPDPEGRAGAAVLPRAYHVLDVIRFRGRLYASTGSVPPNQRPWFGPSPGALHVANERWNRWTYETDYPFPWQNGVWRLTFMTRFRGRLYAGIQDYDWREPNDFVMFDPPAGARVIDHPDAHPTRITEGGGAQTLRWFTDHGRLFWLALERGMNTSLRVTDDGDHWRTIAFPADAGRPVGITRFRGAVVVLTERQLFRLEGEHPVAIATVSEQRSPFALSDIFCAAPLAVFHNALYAGGQRDGALYRLADGEAPSPAPAATPRR